MIQYVYENALCAQKLEKVIVATDDTRIADCVTGFGGEYILTDKDIPTGTERVAKAAESIEADIILNIQGDEPLVPPELMDLLVETTENMNADICTPAVRIKDPGDITDPNQARVVFDKNNMALYFTRSAVPFNRDEKNIAEWLDSGEYWKHIGIYCFKRKFLFKFISLPESGLEKTEKLEQLRILENGYPVHIVKTDYQPVCVDVPEDISKVEAVLGNR